MIAIIDTCTILHLLQINYDDKYINLLEKTFEEVKIVPIVYVEICKNKYENIIDVKNKELIDSIIFKQIKNFIANENFEKADNFTKKSNNGKYKYNGESLSVSYALARSRIGENDFGENLLKTHFISDDSPAKNDFEYFFKINVLGQIIDSIDLMTIFCLKGFISKNEVLNYCNSLKQLYNKELSILLSMLKIYSYNQSENIDSKEKMVITKLIEILSAVDDDLIEKLNALKENSSYKSIIKRKFDWDNQLTKIIESNFREKIPNINKRITDFSKVWEIDYN